MLSVTRKKINAFILALGLTLALAAPVLAGAIIGGTQTISASTILSESGPALAYNPDREEYLAVWWNDRPGVNTNDDIQAWRLDKHGRKIGGTIFISAGPGHERRYPDVAYNPQHQQYLVVWEHLQHGGYKSIRARRLSGTGAVIDQNDIVLTGDSNLYTPEKPAVAYADTSDLYMVVWAETWHPAPLSMYIYAQAMNAQGFKVGSVTEVSKSPYHHDEPDIAYNRHANRHLVVWEQKAGAGQPTDVRGRQVKGDGGTYGSAFNIAYFTVDTGKPAVAAIPTSPGDIKFLVVYQLLHSAGDYDIYGNFVEEDGTLVAGDLHIARSNNSETAPAVAGSEDAQEYLVLWREDAGIVNKPIKARRYDSRGADLGAAFELGGPATDQPALTAGYMGDFLLAWQDRPIAATYAHLYGALYGNRNYLPLISY